MAMIRSTDAAVSIQRSYGRVRCVEVGENFYPEDVETIRDREYPALNGTTYLDHSGTTLYAKSMIESYTADLTSHIFGNPHSVSASSQLSSDRVDDVRLKVLRFFNADPEEFDVIFVANATAAIRLVSECFRDLEGGFWYGYHGDAHTSLVGVRQVAALGSSCFCNDLEAQKWIDGLEESSTPKEQVALFAYPGQSNMTGRKLPYDWCRQIRSAALESGRRAFTLFDVAALASTSALDFANADNAPDFTALSFYKIFGFPDLGALVVRKASGDILRSRKFFGGGTVDILAACSGQPWHMKKQTLHDAFEDGTLPFHNIIALDHALKTHKRLYGSMSNITKHTAMLRAELYDRISKMRHNNGAKVCKMHSRQSSDNAPYGPVIAFNILDNSGRYVSNSEVEKLGIVKNIQFRTGGLCNPGGIARHLGLSTDDLKQNYAAGHRCGAADFFLNGKPTGVVRVSLGAMSTKADVLKFVEFLEEFYLQYTMTRMPDIPRSIAHTHHFYIKSMSVFPIKSCAAFKIPIDIRWQISSRGLAWDREWCLVHQGTNVALSQKRYPKMAMIQPKIDTEQRLMVVSSVESPQKKEISIKLDEYPSTVGALSTCQAFRESQSLVCGERVSVYIYTSPEINDFFSEVIGVPCALARHSYMESSPRVAQIRRPKPKMPGDVDNRNIPPAMNLSNESPILLVSQSSVNLLNEQIQQKRGVSQEILHDSFRANIVIAEIPEGNEGESPYAEDFWKLLTIGSGGSAADFDVLGPCQRCQMVCVDQSNAKRRQEPFSTLAKTRRWDGGVWFGVHLCLSGEDGNAPKTFQVGEPVLAS